MEVSSRDFSSDFIIIFWQWSNRRRPRTLVRFVNYRPLFRFPIYWLCQFDNFFVVVFFVTKSWLKFVSWKKFVKMLQWSYFKFNFKEFPRIFFWTIMSIFRPVCITTNNPPAIWRFVSHFWAESYCRELLSLCRLSITKVSCWMPAQRNASKSLPVFDHKVSYYISEISKVHVF